MINKLYTELRQGRDSAVDALAREKRSRELREEQHRQEIASLSHLANEVEPLRQKLRQAESLAECLNQENAFTRTGLLEWQQEALALSKESKGHEDWQRLLTEHEKLGQLLAFERATFAKGLEELEASKTANAKLAECITLMQQQIEGQNAQIVKISAESHTLNNNLSESFLSFAEVNRQHEQAQKQLEEKERLIIEMKREFGKIARQRVQDVERLERSLQDLRGAHALIARLEGACKVSFLCVITSNFGSLPCSLLIQEPRARTGRREGESGEACPRTATTATSCCWRATTKRCK